MTSIDPLYVLRGASTTNYFHHKFCVLHCPLIARLKLKRQRALVVHRIDRFASGHSYLQRPARIEMRWCGSFSTTPLSGGTSRYCAAVSALRQ